MSLMSAVVNGELSEPKLSEFYEHIRECPACRAEFEAEKATKAFLRARLKRVKAPKSLVEAIKRQTIGNLSLGQASQFSAISPTDYSQHSAMFPESRWQRLLSRLPSWLFINPEVNRRANSLFALGLALSVLAMLVFAGFARTNPETGLFDSGKAIVASAAPNLCEMVSVSFNPKQDFADIYTTEAQVAANYFARVAGIHAVIPVVKGFSLSSARLTAFGAINACEVFFRRAKSTVAIYFLSEKDVRGQLSLPENILHYISADGRNFYTVRSPQGHHIVLWKWGEVIYAATSDDTQLNLSQLITNPNWN
ncbi:MAG: anti-sigma factor [Chloroherpetonaceae bacterium]|nr:anti-sigma factor [Chloroherpetonaceae bacterium]